MTEVAHLTDAVAAILEEAQRLDTDTFADALSAACDRLATGDDETDRWQEAVIDGIRWAAHTAGATRTGKTVLRICYAEGFQATWQWAAGAAHPPEFRAAVLQSVTSGLGPIQTEET